MSPEEIKLRMQLADVMVDLADHLSRASFAALQMAELLDVPASELKQRRVKTSLRDDAIDELLKREGFTW